MSELNIKVRKSQDNGSTFRATPDTLYMGGVGSAKVDTLHFEVPEEWAGCAITLHVQRLSGALPDPQMLDENNCVVVDRRWTQEKQGSWMLLAVDENGYIAMTKPGQYTCYETIDTNSTTETITPSVYEQFVALVKKWGQTAVDAARAAKESEEQAAGSATEAAGSASAAATSESNAAKHEEAAKQVVTQNAKGYGGGYSRTFTLTAPQTGWAVLEAPIGIYRYYADVALADCTAKWNAFAAVLPESAMTAFVARVANIIETKDGSVRLYAVNAPEEDVKFTLSVFAVGSRTYSLTVPVNGWVQAENSVWANQWQFLHSQ